MLYLSAQKMRLLSASILLFASVVGCGGGVRQDRTVEFSRDGNQVAFQHDDEGVYVANSDGQGVTKIFQPDENVLATSRPLSSPTDGRLIFTTAQPFDEPKPGQQRDTRPVPSEGRIVFQQPVRYSCWIRSDPKGDQPPTVKKLFDASCGHLGYVSAGLAVRWHPDGKHIIYCAAADQDWRHHTIYEFDLATQKSRQVFPHAVYAVVCDWTPSGSHLVCVVSDLVNQPSTDPAQDRITGTWIGTTTDEKSWWNVPGSGQLAAGELLSEIEMLRASRPAWTRDDSKFAFVSQLPPKGPAEKPVHLLQQVELPGRTISTLAEASGSIIDLHWSSDGTRLGYVQQNAAGFATLHVRDSKGEIARLPTGDSIRKFAGFDSTSQQIAYVVASPSDQPADAKRWPLLLVLDSLARDTVRIAPADATVAGLEVFSGMRVTFPLWSPTAQKLSLWLTFTPRYRSFLSIVVQAGLRPGDPAATFDTQTKTISWMAISPQEELQVGHYFLLKRDAAEAWKWYEKAHQKLTATKSPANWQEFVRQVGAPENSQVFEALCLQRLGRDAEAAAKWTEFEQHFFPAPAKPPVPGESTPTDLFLTPLFNTHSELLKPLVHDLFLAEVFLSVDSLDEALAHFRKPPKDAESDSVAFSRAVVLSQLLLIARDYEGYLALCTSAVAPLALKLWKEEKPGTASADNLPIQMAAGLCLAPLFRADFLAQLPIEQVQQSRAAWKELAAKHKSGLPAVAIDLVLRASASRLEDFAEAKVVETRITANPSSQQLFSGQALDDVIAGWFTIGEQNVSRP